MVKRFTFAVPGDLAHPKRFVAVKLDRTDGALLIGQVDYHFGKSSQASVGVNVNVVFPSVTLAPSGTANISKKGTLNMTASPNTPTFGISRVDFLIGTTVVCSRTASPWTCSWKAPASPKTYQAVAKEYDTKGNVGSSAVTTVIVK